MLKTPGYNTMDLDGRSHGGWYNHQKLMVNPTVFKFKTMINTPIGWGLSDSVTVQFIILIFPASWSGMRFNLFPTSTEELEVYTSEAQPSLGQGNVPFTIRTVLS